MRGVLSRACRLSRTFVQKSTMSQSVGIGSFRTIHSSKYIMDEAPPAVEKEAVPLSPKVQALVDELLTLNIMETVELVDCLKEKFGYVEAVAVAAAPAAGGAGGEAAEAEPEAAVQTEFNVRLDSFDAKAKIKVIKEVRAITGLGLKQAKELVESAPKAIIKEGLMKEDAEELIKKIKAVGGECVSE